MTIPNFITEDEAFYYCPKANVDNIKDFSDFITLSDLLEHSKVTDAFYNVIGQIYGKNVVVI